MRTRSWLIFASGSLLAATTFAQGPGDDRGRPGRPPGGGGGEGGGGTEVSRLMAYDKDGNGSLTKAELVDERLHRLFDRADADHDGSVTRKELDALAAAEPAGGGPGGPGGPGGFGPPGGPGGPGGPRGGMMGAAPGEVLPAPMRRMLRLSEGQVEQVEALQKEVDARLDKILTKDQQTQLKQIRERGPGGPGGPGGRFGGPGGPGGPPPRRDGGPDGRP